MHSFGFKGEFVEIIAGLAADSETFSVHKNRLIRESKFVATRLGQNWSGLSSSTVDLQNFSSDIVGIFVEWLYSKKVATSDQKYARWVALFRAFVLGDYLVSPSFQNDVISAMGELKNETKDWPQDDWYIDEAYRNTPKGSVLRKVVVDWHVYEGKLACIVDDTNENLFSDYRLEFFNDLLLEVKQSKRLEVKKENPCWKPGKRYHVKDADFE